MAEYIDREHVLELVRDYGYGQSKMLLIDPAFVKKLLKADVIERSKIDKAIEEIIEYRDDVKNDFCEVEVGVINGVLKILKRNIGRVESRS